jgi:7-carboxy-7-deazaguanine synthase
MSSGDRLAPLRRQSGALAEPALVVNEVYASVQGESSWAGLPCAFVRLTACNLRCRWCDSTYTFHEGEARAVRAIVAEVVGFGLDLVEITGGEPLLQPEVHTLIGELLERGLTVLVETSGSVDVSSLDARAIKILDLKCPGSGEAELNRWSNLDRLGPRDEIKFVIADRRDYEWARAAIAERKLAGRAAILMSPVHGELDPRELVAWMLEDRLAARLNLQLHKYVWPEATRGV